MSFEQFSKMPEEKREETEETLEKKEKEKTLETVLELLENKKKKIVEKIRPKLHPNFKEISDSNISETYGRLERLREYNLCSEESIEDYAAIDFLKPSSKDRALINTLTDRGYLLKEYEDAMLIGALSSREKIKKIFDKKKWISKKRTEEVATRGIARGQGAIAEAELELKKTQEGIVEKLGDKFTVINAIYPFTRMFSNDFWKREIREDTIYKKGKNIEHLGFSRNLFGKLLDLMDLDEAGIVELKKMDGLQIVNLYEQAKTKWLNEQLKILQDAEKLREAYLEGIIGDREEYLDLLKQSFDKNKWEKGF